MPTLRQFVIDILHSMEESGGHALSVDTDARGILRMWMLASRQSHGERKKAPADHLDADPGGGFSRETAPRLGVSREMTLSEMLQEYAVQAREEEQEEREIPFFRPGGRTTQEKWEQFALLLPQWGPLRELGSLRKTAVMGTGNRCAEIAFVSDAPNYYDEQAGRPLAGAAGQKFDGILKAMGLNRELVYLTYGVKFRPQIPHQTTNNRPPSDVEISLSRPVLETEMRLVKPKVIVALGVIAARCLLNGDGLPLDALRGRVHDFLEIPVVVSHHPSYLLRTSDLGERRRFWEDMLLALETARMPVTHRQKGYFLPGNTGRR
ncbi:MAG: uracil-DNA glycosylase [Akkermansiaceae bacterium]|nr:uracil-DNA glycosylase [Akkermansiaceae bacterium]